MICESFLREALLGAQFTHTFAKRQKDLLHPRKSGDMIQNRLQTERRQTNSKYSLFVLSLGSIARRVGIALDTTATSAKLFSLSVPRRKIWIYNDVRGGAAVDPQHAQDEVLLKRVQDGDKEAMSCLFRRYAHTLHGLGRRILRDTAEAEDLVQDVFVYVYRKCSVYDPSKGPARSWIIQVGYTQAFLRRRQLRALGFYASAPSDRSMETQPLTSSEADYDHTVEGLFGRNGWKSVVAELTEDQRETLRLHFFEGLTFAEIAEKLGQSHRNIRNHHYRGLEKLRKQMAKNELNAR